MTFPVEGILLARSCVTRGYVDPADPITRSLSREGRGDQSQKGKGPLLLLLPSQVRPAPASVLTFVFLVDPDGFLSLA